MATLKKKFAPPLRLVVLDRDGREIADLLDISRPLDDIFAEIDRALQEHQDPRGTTRGEEGSPTETVGRST